MPFNLGKGKKAREGEQPSPTEAADELAAGEPEVEVAVEEVQTTPDQETEAEQERASEENAEQPAGPRPSVASSFRPSFLDPDSPERPRKRSAEVSASQPSRGAPYFVTVRDEAGNVSIQRFDDRKDAEAHIELLLDEGVDAGAIAVHRGRDIGYQVTRRPIVQLANPDPQ